MRFHSIGNISIKINIFKSIEYRGEKNAESYQNYHNRAASDQLTSLEGKEGVRGRGIVNLSMCDKGGASHLATTHYSLIMSLVSTRVGDPGVFGPPGSGSDSQEYGSVSGSGSFLFLIKVFSGLE